MRYGRLASAASIIGFFAIGSLTVSVSAASAQGKVAEDAAPKQVALTQKQIDGLLSAQKGIHAIEAKVPEGGGADKPDPTVDAALDAVAKKNGFSSFGDYSDASSSVAVVMAGMDPQTKTYVGPEVVIKKQIAEVEADKTMPPKEKKETLDELKGAMAPATSAQPSAGNIALVAKNYDALSKSLQDDAD